MARTKRDSGRDPADIDPTRRIYVNRNLRLASIQAIGFDMDHTLACYKAAPFERLAFQKSVAKLVAQGHPREMLRLKYDPGFVVRGLLVDKARGNILKMDRHHYVVQAYHGTRKIPAEMRKKLYARERRIRPGGTFVPVDTLFSLPEIGLYAQIVDLLESRGERPDFRRLYDGVRRAVDEAHADGSIKDVIARDPLSYLDIDPLLPQTLNRMRSHGLRLFLLTNSEPGYTTLIMDHLLSGRLEGCSHWTDFFNLVVMRAGKPGFFGRQGPLQALSASSLGVPRGRPAPGLYKGGSFLALERALRVSGERILFFGDHTYGDILKSKRICGWRTAMIMQRLEDELRNLAATRQEREAITVLERRIDRLSATRDFLERAVEGQVPRPVAGRFLREHQLAGGVRAIPGHLASMEKEIEALGHRLDRIKNDVESAFNPRWGPIFRAGREITHFAAQVQEFACIYTSRVSNFLNYPMDKYFVTDHVFMPHEL